MRVSLHNPCRSSGYVLYRVASDVVDAAAIDSQSNEEVEGRRVVLSANNTTPPRCVLNIYGVWEGQQRIYLERISLSLKGNK